MSQGFEVRRIEEELNQLWKGMSAVEEQEKSTVLRACVVNLIIFNAGPWPRSSLDAVLSDLTREHPGRILVVCAQPESALERLEVQVTAQCYPRARERKQVCCECIRIQAEGGALREIPSMVPPLLVPDLPVALWWRTEPWFEDKVFQRLVQMADRAILDSNTIEDRRQGLRILSGLVQAEQFRTAVTDFNWARITAWRRAVSGFFDLPRWRNHLSALRRVEIDSTFTGEGQAFPVQAWLLAGWLGSRLGWKVTGNLDSQISGKYVFEADSEGRTVQIEIRRGEGEETEISSHRISRMALAAAIDGETLFEFLESSDRRHIEASIHQNGEVRGRRVSQNLLEDETCLICRELEILSHDEVYEGALGFLSKALP